MRRGVPEGEVGEEAGKDEVQKVGQGAGARSGPGMSSKIEVTFQKTMTQPSSKCG